VTTGHPLTGRSRENRRATSYDVKVWKISVYKGKRGRTYTLRWEVAGDRKQRTFKTRALAESFRAELLSAARGGEAFDRETGLPVSKLVTDNGPELTGTVALSDPK
jgi:hypothetical protein